MEQSIDRATIEVGKSDAWVRQERFRYTYYFSASPSVTD
jgi:hypothetical protein